MKYVNGELVITLPSKCLKENLIFKLAEFFIETF